MKRTIVLSMFMLLAIVPSFALPKLHYTSTPGGSAISVACPPTLSFGGACITVMSLTVPSGSFLLSVYLANQPLGCWLSDTNGVFPPPTGGTVTTTDIIISKPLTTTSADTVSLVCPGNGPVGNPISFSYGSFSALQVASAVDIQ